MSQIRPIGSPSGHFFCSPGNWRQNSLTNNIQWIIVKTVKETQNNQGKTKMTKQEKIQQDIQFAENRLAMKEVYIPTLLARVTDQTMIQRYMDEIEQEKQRIAKWTAKLAR
jgi:hypothetical protein